MNVSPKNDVCKLTSKIFEEQVYLTIPQLMFIFQLSRTSIYKLMAMTDFPKCLSITSRKLWKTTDIVAWADKHMVVPTRNEMEVQKEGV